MAPCADSPARDFVPPPSYHLSQEQFDRKTSHAIQLSSSIRQPIIDEDGWPIYDPAVFEAVANSYAQTPHGSSSAGADIPRHGRQASYAGSGLPPPTDSMKVRSSLSFSHFIANIFTRFHRLDHPNGADGIISSQIPIILTVSQPLLHLSVQLVPLWMAHHLSKL